MSTYYEILDVDENATQREIKQAYHRRVKETHPDQNDEEGATEQFIQVKKAYDVLGVPDERDRYDRLGHTEYLRQTGDSPTGKNGKEPSYEQSWKQHTRNSTEAEYLRDDVSYRINNEAPVYNSASNTLQSKVLHTAIAGSAVTVGFICGFILYVTIMGSIGIVDASEYDTGKLSAMALAGTAVMISLVLLSERVFDTYRKTF